MGRMLYFLAGICISTIVDGFSGYDYYIHSIPFPKPTNPQVQQSIDFSKLYLDYSNNDGKSQSIIKYDNKQFIVNYDGTNIVCVPFKIDTTHQVEKTK